MLSSKTCFANCELHAPLCCQIQLVSSPYALKYDAVTPHEVASVDVLKTVAVIIQGLSKTANFL